MVVGEPTPDGSRWRARPVMYSVVVTAVLALPVVGAIGAAALSGHLLAGTSTGAPVRWLAVLGFTTVVFVACERIARSTLPVTVLLRLGLVFPDAPRRAQWWPSARGRPGTRAGASTQHRCGLTATKPPPPPSTSWSWSPSAPKTAGPADTSSGSWPSPSCSAGSFDYPTTIGLGCGGLHFSISSATRTHGRRRPRRRPWRLGSDPGAGPSSNTESASMAAAVRSVWPVRRSRRVAVSWRWPMALTP